MLWTELSALAAVVLLFLHLESIPRVPWQIAQTEGVEMGLEKMHMLHKSFFFFLAQNANCAIWYKRMGGLWMALDIQNVDDLVQSGFLP